MSSFRKKSSKRTLTKKGGYLSQSNKTHRVKSKSASIRKSARKSASIRTKSRRTSVPRSSNKTVEN